MPEIRGSTFDLHTALWLAEEREVNMLACIDVLGKENGGALHVAELPRALKVCRCAASRAASAASRRNRRAPRRARDRPATDASPTPPVPPRRPQSLELCEGITHEQVQRVVERTAASLGHTQTSRLSHDACVLYYNALVEFVNSYEARLANPSQNCTPQYTVAGLDMPPCFWINLERGADRRANMRRLLQGYRHTRVPAVDAQAGAWLDECAALGLDRPLRATAAERCCTMSHVRALEAIAAAGVPLALVLEDDVTFKFIHPSFSFERTVADLPADWDVLHISARRHARGAGRGGGAARPSGADARSLAARRAAARSGWPVTLARSPFPSPPLPAPRCRPLWLACPARSLPLPFASSPRPAQQPAEQAALDPLPVLRVAAQALLLHRRLPRERRAHCLDPRARAHRAPRRHRGARRLGAVRLGQDVRAHEARDRRGPVRLLVGDTLGERGAARRAGEPRARLGGGGPAAPERGGAWRGSGVAGVEPESGRVLSRGGRASAFAGGARS
jgi:hypothetical protein